MLVSRRFQLGLLALFAMPMTLPAAAPAVWKDATVLLAAGATLPEKTAATMVVEEVEKRTGLRWPVATEGPRTKLAILLVTQAEMMVSGESLGLPADQRQHALSARLRPEGFALSTGQTTARTWIVVEGADARGVLFGAGYLLRQLAMQAGSVALPEGLESITTMQTPAYAVRGHQLGYRPKNNTFDGWTAAQFEQYIRDLAVFGTDTIELIPPRSDDDATSPLFTLPPMEMMEKLSATIDRYGLDCSIWYPAMDKDYSDAATVDRAVAEWGAVFRALPRVDAVFVPGGDPGHTEPKYLMGLLEREATELRKTHPRAQMWVSPQSFDAAWLAEFYGLLRAHPQWLTGVVYGPEMRESPEAFRAHVPSAYPIRFYPDITHTAAAQYPVPHWDAAYAMTEGREPVNPRPVDEGVLFQRYQPLMNGFVAYSEGSNDDINKMLWSGWGWDPTQPASRILEEYGRYFLSPGAAKDFARGVGGLEENWRGPLAGNSSVAPTLRLFEALGVRKDLDVAKNWRLQQVLYRANYDAYLQDRVRREGAQEGAILRALERAANDGPEAALSAAASAAVAAPQCDLSPLCLRVSALADDLFRTVRMQLSVPRYKALAVGRGANFDSVDAAINDVPWLRERIALAQREEFPGTKATDVQAILAGMWPAQGGSMVDETGVEGRHPHLLTGSSFVDDPSGLSGVFFGAAGDSVKSPQPLFARTFAGTLYDLPLRMRYTELARGGRYRVQVRYPANAANYRIEANGVNVTQRCGTGPICTEAEFDIPSGVTQSGEVTLAWIPPPGLGGNGRTIRISRVEVDRVQ